MMSTLVFKCSLEKNQVGFKQGTFKSHELSVVSYRHPLSVKMRTERGITVDALPRRAVFTVLFLFYEERETIWNMLIKTIIAP